jgi:hypothetical protein
MRRATPPSLRCMQASFVASYSRAGVGPPGPARERTSRHRVAERLLRDVRRTVTAGGGSAIARLGAMVPLGDVQRNLQRCLLRLRHQECPDRDVNASHSHCSLLAQLGATDPQEQNRNQHRSEARTAAAISRMRTTPCSRLRLPDLRPRCTSVTRLPDVSGGRRRARCDCRHRVAERLLRDVLRTVTARGGSAIARLGAMLPLGDVQRNLQRCLLATTNARDCTTAAEPPAI